MSPTNESSSNSPLTSDEKFSKTYQITKGAPSWHITTKLFYLDNPDIVYQAVVKARFPAAFLNPAMISGNAIDLQIASAKALSRYIRTKMITKSLPMELLYALSPRNGISDALKYFGFKPTNKELLVVWIHSSPEPPPEAVTVFDELITKNGRQMELDKLSKLADYETIANVYDFPRDIPGSDAMNEFWRTSLLSYVTSKIAVKE